jgi:glutamine---fructose-6-phosphate transaminase (isomerizing)
MSALGETIRAQPQLLERALEIELGDAPERLGAARRVWLVGTGTSQHAAEIGAWLFEEAGRDAHSVSSARFARLGVDLSGDAVIVLSHTGGTAYAVAARERARAAAAALISITGQSAGWPEAIETVPHERSETYTASYTVVLVVLARLAVALGLEELGDQLQRVPQLARSALERPGIDAVQPPQRLIAVAGSGPSAITAREGALKLREAARLPAEGYEAEYLLHGSAVPLDDRDLLLLLQPDGDPDGLVAGVGEAARAAGVATAELTDGADLHPLLAQIPLTVPLQLLADRLAAEGGHDPDTVITGPWRDDDLWSRGRPGSDGGAGT